MSIQAIEAPPKTRSAAARPEVQGPDSKSDAAGTDAEFKRKLEELLPQIEAIIAALMRALGSKEAGDSGGADAGGDCPESGGGGGGSPAGASGGATKGAGGGGGSPKGTGGGEGPKGAGKGEQSSKAGAKAGTSQPDGKGGATVDINGDGKADVHVSGKDAEKYAANFKKFADENSEFKDLALKSAQQKNGVLEINRTQDLGGPSGTAAEGTGTVNIAPEPDGKLSKHVLVHELLHTLGETHLQRNDSAAMREQTNGIVGSSEADNLVHVLADGTRENPDGTTG